MAGPFDKNKSPNEFVEVCICKKDTNLDNASLKCCCDTFGAVL